MDNESTASLLRLELNVLPAVNYALEQNGVPILRSLVIVNDSDIAYEHVDLRFTTRPMLCVPMSRHIDYLPPHSAFEVKDAVLRPNASYFAGLTERESGLLSVRLFQGETALCAAEAELVALAFDQWHGSAFCPELLCAFVTPNHPALVPCSPARRSCWRTGRARPRWTPIRAAIPTAFCVRRLPFTVPCRNRISFTPCRRRALSRPASVCACATSCCARSWAPAST